MTALTTYDNSKRERGSHQAPSNPYGGVELLKIANVHTCPASVGHGRLVGEAHTEPRHLLPEGHGGHDEYQPFSSPMLDSPEDLEISSQPVSSPSIIRHSSLPNLDTHPSCNLWEYPWPSFPELLQTICASIWPLSLQPSSVFPIIFLPFNYIQFISNQLYQRYKTQQKPFICENLKVGCFPPQSQLRHNAMS